MTQNEKNRQQLQDLIDNHYGAKDVVLVKMVEAWNYNATYSWNGCAHKSFDDALKQLSVLAK